MLTSLDRTHFFIPIGHPHVRDALTAYVDGTAGSVFHRFSATGAVHTVRRAAYHQAMPGLWPEQMEPGSLPGQPQVIVNGDSRAGSARQVEDRTVRDQFADA
jgi:hypothetical protein